MTLLAAVNVLLVGLWVGMYLFTTFVVSPAFRELYPDHRERQERRHLVGRYYARLNGPLTALLVLVALLLGWTQGWSLFLEAELLLLALMAALIAQHVRQARAQGTPPGWLTHLTLTSSVLLCGAACASAVSALGANG